MKRLTALFLAMTLCLGLCTFTAGAADSAAVYPTAKATDLTNVAGYATYKGEGIDNGTTGNYCEAPGTDWEVYHTGKLNDGVIPTDSAANTLGQNVEFWHANATAGVINVFFKFSSAINVQTVNVFMNDRDDNADVGYPTSIKVYVGNSESVSSASLMGTATTADTGWVRNYTVSGNLTGSYVILQFTAGTQYRITCSEVQIMSTNAPAGALAAPVISSNLTRMETFEAPIITWPAVKGAVSYDAYIDGVLVTKGITGTSYVVDMDPIVDYEGSSSYTEVQIRAKGDGETYTDSALSTACKFFYVEKPLDLRGNRVTSADIIIDPGHGGSQPGACNGTRQEKDDTLNMSLKLGEKLEKMGYTVAFCRIEDVDDGLMSRAAKANAGDFDLFICIHRNSYNTTANGIETLYETGDTLDKAFAQAVQDQFVALGLFTNRGLKPRDNLTVTNNARDDLPTILVELGFIDNAADNAAFDNYFDEIAMAMVKGCMTYQGMSFGTKGTLTVDGEAYSYTGTALNITAKNPTVAFEIANGYGISGIKCTDGAGTFNATYQAAQVSGYKSAVKGEFTVRASAAADGTVTTTVKLVNGFGEEKTVATITCSITAADPFTFNEGADTTSIAINSTKGYLTFSASVMTSTSIMELFVDTDMKIVDSKGNTPGASTYISTGYTITTTVNGVTSALDIVVYGDIDGDCSSTSSDYQILKLFIMERTVLQGAYGEAADVVHDNDLSTSDLMLLRMQLINNA